MFCLRSRGLVVLVVGTFAQHLNNHRVGQDTDRHLLRKIAAGRAASRLKSGAWESARALAWLARAEPEVSPRLGN